MTVRVEDSPTILHDANDLRKTFDGVFDVIKRRSGREKKPTDGGEKRS